MQLISTINARHFSWARFNNTPGIYDFRYFPNDVYTPRMALSNPVKVIWGPNRQPVITSSATANPNPADVGQVVSFSVSATDPDGDALTYSWTFGDGASASAAAASHAYTTAGSFSATVTITDGRGGRVSDTISVTVNQQLLTLTATSPVTTGGNITVTWSGASITTPGDWIGLYLVGAPDNPEISWQYTGGLAAGSLTFVAPNSPGTYDFRYFPNDVYTPRMALCNPVSVDLPADPTGAGGAVAGRALTITGLSGQISKPAQLGILSLSGNFADESPLAAVAISIRRAGVTETFSINARGTGVSENGAITITSRRDRKGVRYFKAKIRSSALTPELAQLDGEGKITLSVTLTSNGATHGESVLVKYRADSKKLRLKK